MSDDLARETFVEADPGPRASDEFHTQRNTLFTYVHASDAAEVVRRTVEAEFDGHERVWVSAPDTSAETPTRKLVADVFPDVERRDTIDTSTHGSLVDTSKARDLFDWEPDWSWRQLS